MVPHMEFLFILWYPKGSKKNWPKCHSGQSVSGQSVIGQSVTSQRVTGQNVSLAKVSLAKVSLAKGSLWPKCHSGQSVPAKCLWPKCHSGQNVIQPTNQLERIFCNFWTCANIKKLVQTCINLFKLV